MLVYLNCQKMSTETRCGLSNIEDVKFIFVEASYDVVMNNGFILLTASILIL